MALPRLVKGVGQAVNPLDGDRVVIELGVRAEKIAYVGAMDIRTGSIRWVGATRKEVSFNSGAEARAHWEGTFAGCETARRTALILFKVFIGRRVEDALQTGTADLIAQMESHPTDSERCVATVLEAVRNALIDVQVTTLAEFIVEARRLQSTG